MGEYRVQEINIKDKQFDETTFNRFFDEYYDKLYNYLFFTLKNPRHVEDLTSEIVEKIVRSLATYEEEKSSLNTWIFSIAKNHLTDYYRGKQRQEKGLDQENAQSIPDIMTQGPEENLLEVEKQDFVRELVNLLPQREREMVILKFWGGLKNVEIASQMGCTPNQVNVSVHRSLKKLKNAMGEGEPTWAK